MTTVITLFLSVLAGVLLLFVFRPGQQNIRLLLTFSGGYLLSITLTHLFPEIYGQAVAHTGIWVVAGLIFQLVLDFFSHGIDHGHYQHIDKGHFPWALFLTLSLHSFMEGLPLSDPHHGHLLWAIAIHKVPVSMMLAGFFLHAGVSFKKAGWFIFLFALMSPLGSVISGYTGFFIRNVHYINAWVAGAFMHIATVILFESSQEHRFNIKKFSALLAGVVLSLWV